jgi:hypothetical protein
MERRSSQPDREDFRITSRTRFSHKRTNLAVLSKRNAEDEGQAIFARETWADPGNVSARDRGPLAPHPRIRGGAKGKEVSPIRGKDLRSESEIWNSSHEAGPSSERGPAS